MGDGAVARGYGWRARRCVETAGGAWGCPVSAHESSLQDASAQQASAVFDVESAVGEFPLGRNWTALERPGFLSRVEQACGAFEWVTITYLAWLLAIFVTCHANIAHSGRYIALHVAIGAAIAAVCVAAERWPSSEALRFIRSWYPLPLYIFFFEELQALVHAIFPGWFDRWLIAFDYGFAQVHPAVWLAQFANPALNDFMQLCYMTYFLFLVLLPAVLYLARERAAFWTVMTATAMAHYTVYVIALLFPIESPYYALASVNTKPLVGGPFTATIELVEHFGRVHGAAFPSAHVAGSMVAIWAAARYRRGLFWACLPFFVGMCVATVYGRYHYVADVLAGIVVGSVAWFAAERLMLRRGAVPGVVTFAEHEAS
jgi:membrane-associated phospholipid phosphatase